MGRFVKIVLKISLFYIYRRHSNRKPERSWNNTILWFNPIQGHIFRLWIWLWEHLKCSAVMWNFLKLQWKGELRFIEEVSQRCDAARIPKTAFDGDDPFLILTIWGCVRKNQKCNFFLFIFHRSEICSIRGSDVELWVGWWWQGKLGCSNISTT